MSYCDPMSLADVLGERVDIAGLPDALLAAGVHAFTTADAAAAAEIKPDSARPALARLIKNGLAFSPARGLYIPIPPEFRTWGAVPALWFIDSLMAHLERTYYVGYLSAAELHGAAHQRPQALQVVVDRDLRDRIFGRVRLRFITNREAGDLPTVRQNTPTGTAALSTPVLTALDLANHPDNGGALHNVATVLIDLAREGRLDDAELAKVARKVPVAASRRVGWIVESHTDVRLDALAQATGAASGEPSKLDQHGPRRGQVDRRWRLRINAVIEPDL
jgi:predicted transcriptional regulator of viral defense system